MIDAPLKLPVISSFRQRAYQQALDAATSALMAFPRHVTLRAKTMFLVHGLIPCLGEGLLRGLSLTALLALVQGGDGKDLMEVSWAANREPLARTAPRGTITLLLSLVDSDAVVFFTVLLFVGVCWCCHCFWYIFVAMVLSFWSRLLLLFAVRTHAIVLLPVNLLDSDGGRRE